MIGKPCKAKAFRALNGIGGAASVSNGRRNMMEHTARFYQQENGSDQARAPNRLLRF